jgi:flagellar basal-body rod protein FlgB
LAAADGKPLPPAPPFLRRRHPRSELARFLQTFRHDRQATAIGRPAHDRGDPIVNERLFGIHGATLTLRSERMGVIASNIANAATPGYKARDIDFTAALDARLAGARGDAAANPDAGRVWRVPTMPSLDGNTVELAREQVAFAENAVAYSATLSFVQGKVNTVTRALKGE